MDKINFFELSVLQRDAMVHFGWIATNGLPLKKGIKMECELTLTEIKATLWLKHELVSELNKMIQQSGFML